MSTAAPWRSRIVGHDSVPPAELVPNPENWRSHPQAQRDALGGALEDVGWVTEVIVNKTTGHLVDGHLRLDIALSRNEPLVPVTYVDLTEDEERLVLATLDPLAAMADAEIIPLGELLEQLRPENAALRGMLDNLAGQYGLNETKVGLTDPDDVPPLGEDTHIRRGDLFALGDHRLLCGDATDAGDVGRLIGESAVELLFTDPPYGVDYVGKTRDHLTIENDALGAEAQTNLVGTALRRANLGPGVPWYVCAPGGDMQLPFLLAIRDAGLRMRQVIVWVKDRFVLGRSDYHYQHEDVITGETLREESDREGERIAYGFNPGVAHPWNGGRRQSTVWDIERPSASRDHPTQKPIELVRRAVRNSSARGALIYDPFVGSGTTLVAAEQLDRRCCAMDIDPRYVAVSIERWERFTGRTAEQIE